MMKKPNPVPDPIVPEGFYYRTLNLHLGNTTQLELDALSGVNNCRYVTIAYLYKDGEEGQAFESIGLSCCSPLDSPNRRFGTITAVHRAVRNLDPDFYKNLRLAKKAS